ncbi:hypothetical protein, partial [Klebsiella quasipneumoniae]|uniref:hypothetical protein n=1 Tax=Klebsiella quasipneumoniae TaxID=1463165 RepID=UPI001BA516A2
RVWRRLLENSLSAKVSCWLIRLLILGSGYNTMISHLGLIRTFPKKDAAPIIILVIIFPAQFRLIVPCFQAPSDP